MTQKTGGCTRSTARDEPNPSREAHDALEAALFEIKRVIVGQEAMLERVLVALLAGGHVLLEGVPGLAKTLTVKTVADVLGGSFKRLQFTPDLVPGRPRRHAHLPAGHGRLRHRARPGVLQLPARRRDQPRARQGAVGAARGHAGAPGHDRPRDAPRARSRSSCWRRRTRSSPRAPTRCPRRRSTASCSSSSSTTRRTRDEVAVVERSLDGGGQAREVLSPEQLADAPARGRAPSYVDRRVMEYAVALTTATREPRRGELGRVRRLAARLDQPRSTPAARWRCCAGATTCCPSTCATSRATCCATGSCSPTRRWPPASTPTACSTTCSSACRCRASSSPQERIALAAHDASRRRCCWSRWRSSRWSRWPTCSRSGGGGASPCATRTSTCWPRVAGRSWGAPRARRCSALLALAALLVALARPQRTVAAERREATVMLVTDTSGSMHATDVKPDRLAAAQAAARTFAEQGAGRLPPRAGQLRHRTPQQLVGADDRPRAGDARRSTRCRSRARRRWATRSSSRSTRRATPVPDGLGGTRRLPAAIVLLSDGASTRGDGPDRRRRSRPRSPRSRSTRSRSARRTARSTTRRGPARDAERCRRTR